MPRVQSVSKQPSASSSSSVSVGWRDLFRRLCVPIFRLIVVFFMIVVIVQSFLFGPGRVNGRSMEPTYTDEELFFINKIVYLFSLPRRFDVVQLIHEEEGKVMIKRIIGLPGETVIEKAGNILIENAQHKPIPFHEDRYLAPTVKTYVRGATTTVQWVIPEGHYFVLGDNRARSTDSRTYGPVPRSNIIGRVMGFERKNRK